MEPATRMQRLFAIVIDSSSISLAFALASYVEIPDSVRLIGLVAGAGIFAANLYFLAKDGQTLGKKAVGIRIVLLETQQNGGFVTNVLKRGFLAGLPYFVFILFFPILGALYLWADALFIFRENRRCLHDLIAGTLVVQYEGEESLRRQ